MHPGVAPPLRHLKQQYPLTLLESFTQTLNVNPQIPAGFSTSIGVRTTSLLSIQMALTYQHTMQQSHGLERRSATRVHMGNLCIYSKIFTINFGD